MAKNRPTHIAKPVYPGGITAMKKFVGEHLKYPAKALEAKVEGTVTIRYSLDYRGKVVDTKIKKGLSHGCDEEAMRVVRLMRWTVPQDRKKKVRIHQDINIHFKLPKAKPKAKLPKPSTPTQTIIAYTTTTGKLTGKVTKKSATDKPQGGGYSYTIKW